MTISYTPRPLAGKNGCTSGLASFKNPSASVYGAGCNFGLLLSKPTVKLLYFVSVSPVGLPGLINYGR
jgi:hypothetical protein